MVSVNSLGGCRTYNPLSSLLCRSSLDWADRGACDLRRRVVGGNEFSRWRFLTSIRSQKLSDPTISSIEAGQASVIPDTIKDEREKKGEGEGLSQKWVRGVSAAGMAKNKGSAFQNKRNRFAAAETPVTTAAATEPVDPAAEEEAEAMYDLSPAADRAEARIVGSSETSVLVEEIVIELFVSIPSVMYPLFTEGRNELEQSEETGGARVALTTLRRRHRRRESQCRQRGRSHCR